VYISEAHASNEWPLGDHVAVTQPTTLEARLENARGFVRATGFPLPLLVDGMEDTFRDAFAAHPERFFVLSAEGTLLLKGQPLEGGHVTSANSPLCRIGASWECRYRYNLHELEDFLATGAALGA
jgi:hypothetical protein